MKLYDLLSSLHTNNRLVIYSAKRVNGKCGYTVLKPLFDGRARDCNLENRFINHVFARGYNVVECYGYDENENF